MTHHEQPVAEHDRLPILVTRTVRPDAETKNWFNVPCPRRSAAIDLAECVGCNDCGGVGAEPRGQGSFLACAWVGEPVAARPEQRSDQVPVVEIMSKDTLCVSPDLSLEALARVLLARGISGAPVVDENGSPIGMVSKSDLVREYQENAGMLEVEPSMTALSDDVAQLGPGFHAEHVREGTVRDIMTPLTFTLRETASIARAAALMAYERIHRAPVVSASGRVVGVVSALDVAEWVARAAGFCIR